MSKLQEKQEELAKKQAEMKALENELVTLKAEAAAERERTLASFTQEVLTEVLPKLEMGRVLDADEDSLDIIDFYSDYNVEVDAVCERKEHVNSLKLGQWNKSYPYNEAVRFTLYLPREAVQELLTKYGLEEA